MEPLLTTGQAARLLGLSRTTVREAIKSGALRCDRRTRGGHARIEAAEVERLRAAMRSRRTTTDEPLARADLDEPLAYADSDQTGAYSRVLGALADAVVAADESGCIVYANAALERLLGWSAAELIGRPLTALMPRRLHDAHSAGFVRFISSRVPRLTGQAMRVPAQRRDGSEVYIELVLSWADLDSSLLVVGTLRDLRERVELERQLAVVRYLRATTNVSATLSSHLDSEHLCQTVVDTLVADFDAALARVWLFDAASARLRLQASAGTVDLPATAPDHLDLDDSPAWLGEVVRTGKPCAVNALALDPWFDQDWVAQTGLAAVAAFPLVVGGALRAIIIHYSRQALPDDVFEVLGAFAAIVRTALSDIDLFAREHTLRAEAEASAAAAAAQARRLALVQETARELTVISSVQETCDRLVQTIYARMGEHVASAFVVQGDEAVMVACRTPNDLAPDAPLRLPIGTGIIGYVAATRRPYLSADTHADPAFHRPSDVGTRSEVAVPIQLGAELIGVLNVESALAGAFGEDDVATLSAIADQAAIAIQNARLYEAESALRRRAEERARRIEHVQRVGERLKVDLDEREVGARVVAAAREALGFRMAVLNLADRPGEPDARARVVAMAGLPPEGEAALTAHDFPLSDVAALFRPEFQLSRSYFIPASASQTFVETDIPFWAPALANSGPEAWGSGDEFLIPLTDREGGFLLGFLSVDDPENGQRPDHEQAEVLEIFADQAVVALRNARLLAEARRQAERDPVTGLFNHRAAHARLDAALNAARAAGGPLGLLALDLDDFKLINDTHGHPSGDIALRHVAGLLDRCARGSDIAARLGGDEFVLILPGADRERSIEVARRLSALSREAPLHIDGVGLLPLQLSIGVAAYPDDTEQPHALFAIADARLYEAKRTGGRGVVAGRDPRDAAQEPDTGAYAGFDMLNALVTAVDNKDRYTSEHSEQVAMFACALAEALGLSRDTQRTLRVAGLLHDVGKIGVPDRILRKPGALEAEEWIAMKQHVTLSAALVQAVVPDPDVLAAVAHHHERWDGKGYPQQLAGAAVPLLGRIMIVADAVSAMAMDRPYRRGLAPEVIVGELRRGAGTQFDPDLVEPFIAAYARMMGKAA